MSEFRAYRDGDRFIIGRASDQTMTSRTLGFASAYSEREAGELVKQFNAKPPAGEPKVYWTDERFETACDEGKFGAEWD